MGVTAQFAPGPLSAAQLNVSSIPVVTATSNIIAPFNGQVVFNTTDNMLYRYDSTVWVPFAATGGSTSATLHEARYVQTVAQTVVTATDTKAKFDTARTTTTDVTPSGTGNTDFLMNRGGLWLFTTSTRYLGNAGGGERHTFLSVGTVLATITNRFAGNTNVNVGASPATVACSCAYRLAAGTSVMVGLFQNAGASVNTDVAFGDLIHFSATWLRA